MADRPRKVVDIFVDPRYTVEQRREIGRQAIKYIKERTSRGNGRDNQPFTQTAQYQGGRDNSRTYADTYRESKEFEIAGKSPRPINLRLSGDMLDSLEVLDVSLSGRVRIGYEAAGDNSDKAQFNEEKGYRFLDLSQSEVDRIQREGAGSVRSSASSLAQSIAERIARGLFGGS